MEDKMDKELIDNIINEYLAGDSMLKLEEKHGICAKTIKKILVEHGVEIRSKNDKLYQVKSLYHFNEHYLDEIDCEEKAYILGLFYSDGCNLSKRNISSIGLIREDENLLNRINELLESDRPLRYTYPKNGKPFATLTLTSKYFCSRLTELGCPSRKSLVLKFPNFLREDLYLPFIRGYFDGDGGLTIYKGKNTKRRHLSITGSKDFIHSLCNFLNEKYNIAYMLRNFERKYDSMVIYQKDDVYKFLQLIYSDANIYMERKYNKFYELKEFYLSLNNGEDIGGTYVCRNKYAKMFQEIEQAYLNNKIIYSKDLFKKYQADRSTIRSYLHKCGYVNEKNYWKPNKKQ